MSLDLERDAKELSIKLMELGQDLEADPVAFIMAMCDVIALTAAKLDITNPQEINERLKPINFRVTQKYNEMRYRSGSIPFSVSR